MERVQKIVTLAFPSSSSSSSLHQRKIRRKRKRRENPHWKKHPRQSNSSAGVLAGMRVWTGDFSGRKGATKAS